jgi:hypothetical protein
MLKLAALAGIASLTLATAASADTTRWDANGWFHMGLTDDGADDVYIRNRAPNADGHLNVWTKWLFARPQQGYRASVVLYEIDCNGPRFRQLQGTYYVDQGLNDVGPVYGVEDWQFANPGSVANNIATLVCS